MAIKFIIDSASDVLPEEAEKLGVIHIPMTVRFGDTEYLDTVNLSHSEFYEKLIESDTLPTTSQIPPAVFSEAMKRATENGDCVIVISISSGFSGTYQSACLAAREFGDKVRVIDSESVCVGERILLEYGLRLVSEGKTADEIVSILNEKKKQIRVLALLDTLEYLKKGGRISAAAALAGGMLGIKPVITTDGGKVTVLGKARGSRQGNNLLRELVSKVGGIDFAMPFALAYSGLSDSLLQKYIADSPELLEGAPIPLPIYTVGCAIGTHAGPGVIAVAFFEKGTEREAGELG
ncbi:MAG: DegV family protein [Clostridia bacterium]|nr:DegV family protein [Clostridia bacterium]